MISVARVEKERSRKSRRDNMGEKDRVGGGMTKENEEGREGRAASSISHTVVVLCYFDIQCFLLAVATCYSP